MRGLNLKMLVATAVLLTGGMCFAEKIDNPQYKNWSKFKPGTTVTIHTESDMMGNKSAMDMTSTLVEVNADKAIVEMKMSMMMQGKPMEMPANKQEIPAQIEKMDPPAGTTKPDVKTSEEEVDVAGTKVKAKVTETTTDSNGTKTTSKAWTSEEVPGMLIKVETTMDGTMKGTSKMAVSSMTIK